MERKWCSLAAEKQESAAGLIEPSVASIGWKGLINDPDLNGRFDIRKGMWLARKVLTDVLSLGLPAATEWVDPITPALRPLRPCRSCHARRR